MTVEELLGREKEKEILDDVWNAKEAEFVAIYGRRRVGKTYLIRQSFSNRGIYLEASGAKDKPLSEQLKNFKRKGRKNDSKILRLEDRKIRRFNLRIFKS